MVKAKNAEELFTDAEMDEYVIFNFKININILTWMIYLARITRAPPT